MGAKVRGVDLAYDDSGGEGASVLLIHGFPLCRRMWRPQVDVLGAAGYRVIAPDLRGFGESAWSAPRGMDVYGDDVVGLLDRLGIEKAAIGGMSMGGYVLLNLLERHADRVGTALFMVTRAAADDEPAKIKRSELASQVAKGNICIVSETFAGVLFAPDTPKERPELVSEVKSWMEKASPDGLIAGLLAMRDRPDYLSKLHGFDLPALIIGARQDLAVPPDHARALANALPQAELHLLDGCGHMANAECPEEFNRSLLDFLHRHWPV